MEETAYLARLFIVETNKILEEKSAQLRQLGEISHIPRFRHHCFLFLKAEIKS